MCTVTIVPLRTGSKTAAGRPYEDGSGPGGFRLAGNRDESRTRPAALPPEVRRFGDLDAILPIDPLSGGTWIAVNTAGVAMTLLNIYPDGAAPAAGDTSRPGTSSRGGLIPSLLHAHSAREASRLAGAIDPSRYAAFRLIVVDADAIVEMVSDGGSLRREEAPRTEEAPALFTSSGLGDQRVRGPRRRLFEQMIAGASAPLGVTEKRRETLPDAQDAYHRHSWPGREPVSVCMRRPEAATVSQTIVEVTSIAVRLVYRPGPPDTPSTSVARMLARERTPVR